MVPKEVFAILLIVVLSICAIITISIAIKTYHTESTSFLLDDHHRTNTFETLMSIDPYYNFNYKLNNKKHSISTRMFIAKEENRFDYIDILERESHHPWGKIVYVLVFYALFVALQVHYDENQQRFDDYYVYSQWIRIIFIPFLLGLFASLVSRQLLLSQTLRKNSSEYQYIYGDIIWNNRNTLKYMIIYFVIFLLSAIFQLFDGTLIVPCMLFQQISPMVTAVTCSVFNFLVSINC